MEEKALEFLKELNDLIRSNDKYYSKDWNTNVIYDSTNCDVIFILNNKIIQSHIIYIYENIKKNVTPIQYLNNLAKNR